jgi:hypothetical protein
MPRKWSRISSSRCEQDDRRACNGGCNHANLTCAGLPDQSGIALMQRLDVGGSSEMPTAFVFAGCGSLGAIQVGVLKELIRACERPGSCRAGTRGIAWRYPARSCKHGGFENTRCVSRSGVVSDPGAFLPQYGGNCAFAAARKKEVIGNPLVFAIVDGKLYFNKDAAVRARWLHETVIDFAKADAYRADLMKSGKRQ